MLEHLLPALADMIGAPGESGDTRFFCLRMVSEVTQMYLLDQVRRSPALYIHCKPLC